MKALVTEIQVGGVTTVYSLEEACKEYLRLTKLESFRPKIHFAIAIGEEHKHITIRDNDSETIAYGDFEGLENFLEYAERVSKAL